MSNEENTSYFDLNVEVPNELPEKTISFIIDQNLEKIWTKIGYDHPQIVIETNKLEMALMKAYLTFIAEASDKWNNLHYQIHESKKQFAKLKKAYGDVTSKVFINDDLPLVKQEEIIAEAIEKLNKKYELRVRRLNELQAQCKVLFDKLGIDDSDRGQYQEVGTEDLTQRRVDDFVNMLDTLKQEEANRVNIYKSCQNTIQTISSELDEPLSDTVIFIFANELVDSDSIQVLTKSSDELLELKKQRYEEYDELVKSVQNYYRALEISPDEQMDIPEYPTRQALEDLENENGALQDMFSEKQIELIDTYKKEIEEVCNEMHVPEKLHPKYLGKDSDTLAKLEFYRSQLNSMRMKRAKVGPIIELINQIEEIKNTKPPSTPASPNPHKTQKMLEHRNQEKISIQLPPLERRLLELLLDFRKENGFDFEFNGITYIDTISQTYLAQDESKFGKTVLTHKSPAPKTIKNMTLSPKSQLQPSPKKYVAKRSPYTPKKVQRYLEDF